MNPRFTTVLLLLSWSVKIGEPSPAVSFCRQPAVTRMAEKFAAPSTGGSLCSGYSGNWQPG
jgi:hypothetical protein